MLIQAFVSELAVKAFHEGILGRFTKLDKAKLNTRFLAPEEHRLTGKLCSVVANNLCWFSSLLDELTHEACNLTTADRDRN